MLWERMQGGWGWFLQSSLTSFSDAGPLCSEQRTPEAAVGPPAQPPLLGQAVHRPRSIPAGREGGLWASCWALCFAGVRQRPSPRLCGHPALAPRRSGPGALSLGTQLASSPSCPFAPACLVRTRNTGFSFWCPAGKPQHALTACSASVSLGTAFPDEVIDGMTGHVPVVQNKALAPAVLSSLSLCLTQLLIPKIDRTSQHC